MSIIQLESYFNRTDSGYITRLAENNRLYPARILSACRILKVFLFLNTSIFT